MDRDKRWDRVEKAYSLLVDGVGEKAVEPLTAIEKYYDQDVTDEFLLPTTIGDYAGMEDGDALLLTNFRADRAREAWRGRGERGEVILETHRRADRQCGPTVGAGSRADA